MNEVYGLGNNNFDNIRELEAAQIRAWVESDWPGPNRGRSGLGL